MWAFTWKWPFVQTWKSKAICCCDINFTMQQVVDALERRSSGYDLYANFSQKPGDAAQAPPSPDEMPEAHQE